MKRKRYWLFGWDAYYPLGAINDFIDSFNTQEEAMKVIEERPKSDYCAILDMDNREWVYKTTKRK